MENRFKASLFTAVNDFSEIAGLKALGWGFSVGFWRERSVVGGSRRGIAGALTGGGSVFVT